MKFEIIKLAQWSGIKCSVYTIQLEDGTVLFEEFHNQCFSKFKNEVQNIYRLIINIAKKKGLQNHYLTFEGRRSEENIYAIKGDPETSLRLYCIKLSNSAIILGSGANKDVRKWQENLNLKRKVEYLIEANKLIAQRIKDKEIRYTHDGDLIGNLKFEEDD